MSATTSAARLRRRYAKERAFRFAGAAAVATALAFLAFLLVDIGRTGWRAFVASSLVLEVSFDSEIVGDGSDVFAFERLIKSALATRFPEASTRSERKELNALVGFAGAVRLKERFESDPTLAGSVVKVELLASSVADLHLKGTESRLTPRQVAWLDELEADGDVEKSLSSAFFFGADSRDPEAAGIAGALVGSLLSLMIAFAVSFPLGILAAVYLEEFAPRNSRWLDLAEIAINNLAAVPSVIFGLLGLAVFINFFGMPRSSPLVGGFVLALMTLPTIVIASRGAIKSVPPSLATGAMALGATKMQAVFHQTLPGAMPGILTGSIIGMAGALGETAPLLMIGMVAFIVDVPDSLSSAATALPVQIFLWADSPERGFVERSAAGIMVLLAFLVTMNAAAVFLRRRLELEW